MAWHIGCFFPNFDDDSEEVNHERIDDRQGIDVAARVCGTPYYFRGGRYLWHIGSGCYYRDDPSDVVRFLVRPLTHEETAL